MFQAATNDEQINNELSEPIQLHVMFKGVGTILFRKADAK
jgi:hypothetical protein